MNYQAQLIQVGQKSAQARALAAQVESERDLLIRQANYHGRLSIREISAAVGISHQRVAQIIAANPIAPMRPKLHEAMMIVLKDFGTDWVPVHEVARLVTERRLYGRKDGHPLPPAQVRARAAKHPQMFEGTTDGTNRIRLTSSAAPHRVAGTVA
jgi:hypothetical protein